MWYSISSMTCLHCRRRFAKRAWPATNNKYCTPDCRKAAFADRHRVEYNQKSTDYRIRNRAKRLATQRRWNNSEAGIAARRRWARAHAKTQYAKIAGTVNTAAVNAREQGRKILRRVRPPVCEDARLPHRGRIECHHRDGNPLNNAVVNLAWLCKRHHTQVHVDQRESQNARCLPNLPISPRSVDAKSADASPTPPAPLGT